MDFTTASRQKLYAESIDTIAILLGNGLTFKLEGVAYAPKCDSKLVSLGQLHDSNINFVDNLDSMTLVHGGNPIVHMRRDQNLFILDLITPRKVLQVSNAKATATVSQNRPTHLISKNKRVRIWHQRIGHASNSRIIRASKLISGMGNFNTKYGLSEIYSNSKYEDSDDGSEQHLTTDTFLASTFLLPKTSNTNNI